MLAKLIRIHQPAGAAGEDEVRRMNVGRHRLVVEQGLIESSRHRHSVHRHAVVLGDRADRPHVGRDRLRDELLGLPLAAGEDDLVLFDPASTRLETLAHQPITGRERVADLIRLADRRPLSPSIQ